MLAGFERPVDESFVYMYRFIDNLDFIQKPEHVLPDIEKTALERQLQAVRDRFLESGWEGDGEIGIFWLPPFVHAAIEDNYGILIWHVKQQNNGISWLLSPIELPLKSLTDQNQTELLIPIGLIEQEVQDFVSKIDTELQLLRTQLSIVRNTPNSDMRSHLEQDLIVFRQGQMVMQYHDFLADCYLQFLREVIHEKGSSEIKLRKSSVALQLSSSFGSVEINDMDNENRYFLTLAHIIRDIWNGYKMASFDEKADMLFKSVDFSPISDHKKIILCHVKLRNCIQHHSSELIPEVLKKLGTTRLEIATSGTPIYLSARDKIILTEEELMRFHNALKQVAEGFEQFVNANIQARAYKRIPS